MSTRTAFAVVGTAIGAYFGNPALGYAIGSMVGGWVDPVKNFGPRLTDAQQQTSSDGVPIPMVFGTVRISGNIIASGPLNEHKHADDGKGSGQVTTTYTYTRTFAIGICEGPITGIRRVWRDGKLVYDAKEFDPLNTQNWYKRKSASAKFSSNAVFYLGDETQMPDSELQSIFGTDSVSANRGLAYIVIKDEDLTDRAGSIPTYEFEVVSSGISGNFGSYMPATYNNGLPYGTDPGLRADPRIDGIQYQYQAWDFHGGGINEDNWVGSYADAVTQAEALTGFTQVGVGSIAGWAPEIASSTGIGYLSGPAPGLSHSIVFPYDHDNSSSKFEDRRRIMSLFARANAGSFAQFEFIGTGGFDYPCNKFSHGNWAAHISSSNNPEAPPGPDVIGSGMLYYEEVETDPDTNYACDMSGESKDLGHYGDFLIVVDALLGCATSLQDGWLPIPGSPGFAVDLLGNVHDYGNCVPASGDFLQLQVATFGTQKITITQFPVGPTLSEADPTNSETFWTAAYEDAVILGEVEAGLVYPTDYPKPIDVACYCSPGTIIIPDTINLGYIVATLCERTGLTPDQVDVSELLDEVIGFTVATDSTAADTINALAPAFQFDGSEWDAKLRFVKRGHGTVASITLDQAIADGSTPRVTETRAQEVELPRKLTLTYQDPAANYQQTTQMSERRSVTVSSTGEASIQLPVVMSTQQAARAVDILLKDKWSALRGTLDETIPDEWSYLTPSDSVYVENEGAVFRIRLGDIVIQNGTMQYTGTQDTQSAYGSTAEGVPPPIPTDTFATQPGPTLAFYFNLPALRDSDDAPGYYVAATGLLAGWVGAVLEQSTNGGSTYATMRTLSQASTMGYLGEVLNDWPADIPQDGRSIVVQIATGADLVSITRAQLMAGANACVIDNEIIQFQDATYLGGNTYRLTNLTRGRKNTETEQHLTGAPFAMLDSLYFIPVDRSVIGSTLTLRMTTSGLATSDGIVSTLPFAKARSVTEWAPTNLRIFRRSSGDIDFSWSPRARMGNALTPYQSTSFTGYRLTVADGPTQKTYPLVASEFTYTAAMQTADFGTPPNPMDYSIVAVNSIIGAGDALEGTI